MDLWDSELPFNRVEFYETMINPIAEHAIDTKITEESIMHIDKEIISNGIKFTLKEAMVDGDTLYLNMIYRIEDSEIIEKFDKDKIVAAMGDIHSELKLNNKNINWDENGIEYKFDNGSSRNEVKEINYYGEEGKNISLAKKLTFQAYIEEEGNILQPYGDSFEIEFK